MRLKLLRFKDEDGLPLVAKIRDSAGQKGTGKVNEISETFDSISTVVESLKSQKRNLEFFVTFDVFCKSLSSIYRC